MLCGKTAHFSSVLFGCFRRRDFSTSYMRRNEHPVDQATLDRLRAKRGFIIDMDGVIYHGRTLLPGAKEFVEWLKKEGKQFLFLTNASEKTPGELSQKLLTLGLDVSKDHFYTSAMATVDFLSSQSQPRGPRNKRVFAIGAGGLHQALYEAGFQLDDHAPDWVVVGETRDYYLKKIETASQLVLKGSRLIATNPDTRDRMGGLFVPSTGALVAPIELVTGKKAYCIGKPNPLIMRTALDRLNCGGHSHAVVLGDRMDTDIVGGLETGMDTVLFLSGVSTLELLDQYPYAPSLVLYGVCDFVPDYNQSIRRRKKNTETDTTSSASPSVPSPSPSGGSGGAAGNK